MKILHIVRRYGPVGGMERYVLELTKSLAHLGHEVVVLCEHISDEGTSSEVKPYSFGSAVHHPRWLAHVLFSRRVGRWVEKNNRHEYIIHSHERCAVHHMTTFHGPPFAPVRDRPFWKRLSLRVAMNLWLEKREVCCDSARIIVPCSKLIEEKLRQYYPDIATKLVEPILPGVTSGIRRLRQRTHAEGGIIGFVGYEWKRKGLDIAIKIVSRLCETRPNLEFWVAGPSPDEIKHLFISYTGRYRLLGQVKTAELYPELDLLLHPARQEPFGMVVMEAMAANVRVVISSDCGAHSEVTDQHGCVVFRDQPLEKWVEACEQMLSYEGQAPGYARSWKQVAIEYERQYQKISAN